MEASAHSPVSEAWRVVGFLKLVRRMKAGATLSNDYSVV